MHVSLGWWAELIAPFSFENTKRIINNVHVILSLLTLTLLCERLSLCEGVLETRNDLSFVKVTLADPVVVGRFRHHKRGAKLGQVVATRFHEPRVQSAKCPI